MDKKLEKAAEKLAKAYRSWIIANAEYNSLLSFKTIDDTFTVNWTKGSEKK